MKVFKFGGASVESPQRMRNLLPIIRKYKPQVIVLSAIGKTTNALEEIVYASIKKDNFEVDKLCTNLKNIHLNYCKALLSDDLIEKCKSKLDQYFNIIKEKASNYSVGKEDFLYDQIVSFGEIMATEIFANYLNSEGESIEWVDIRPLFITNSAFRHADLLEKQSTEKIQEYFKPLIDSGKIILTQGFIGSDTEGNITTLGREGSDYTASFIAAALDASSLTIWKDVPGFLNADPKCFSPTVKIDTISFHEIIELAFYGAKIIHPKTIKPIQNKNIPLYVKSFLEPESSGTQVRNTKSSIVYPSMKVLKDNQTMIQLTTKDFSFIDEYDLSWVYQLCSELYIKVNLIQHTAISLVISINHEDYKIQPFLKAVQERYNTKRNENLNLLTLRHYTEEELKELYSKKAIILEQRTRSTVQLLY
ncbi:MAG TPA: aspartate kinase [Chitinophagaceae bacterium]|nr:aspartate kinase [Chitinophagaceae bacterium]